MPNNFVTLHFRAWFITFFLLILAQSVYANSDGDESYTNQEARSTIGKSCDFYQGSIVTTPPPPITPLTNIHTGLITLWFDDGWVTQFTEAFPLLEKYGYKGAIAVAIKFVCYSSAFMTWDELRFLQSKGWETTAHSVSHSCDFGYYTTASILHELIDSKKIIMAHGLRAEHFVMPCGYSRDQIADHFIDKHPPIVENAKKYFSSYRTTVTDEGNSLPLLDPYNLKAFQWRSTTTDKQIQDAINNAVKNKTWLIFVFHQVDDSKQSFSISPAKLNQILEMIKNSHLPVVVPSQVIPGKTTLDTTIKAGELPQQKIKDVQSHS